MACRGGLLTLLSLPLSVLLLCPAGSRPGQRTSRSVCRPRAVTSRPPCHLAAACRSTSDSRRRQAAAALHSPPSSRRAAQPGRRRPPAGRPTAGAAGGALTSCVGRVCHAFSYRERTLCDNRNKASVPGRPPWPPPGPSLAKPVPSRRVERGGDSRGERETDAAVGRAARPPARARACASRPVLCIHSCIYDSLIITVGG